MMSNKSKDYLDELYNEVHNTANNVSLCSLYSFIVQIKNECPELKDYRETLYVDIKHFIDEYVANISLQERDFGYDVVNVEKIDKHIMICSIAKQRNELYRYASLALSSHGFHEESDHFKNSSLIGRSVSLLRTGNFMQKCRGTLSLIANNVWICIVTIVVVFIIHYMILLPVASSEHAVFLISYSGYSGNFYLNHLLNLLAYLFGVNDTLFCKPTGGTGILISVVLQLFYVLFGGSVLIETLKKYIK